MQLWQMDVMGGVELDGTELKVVTGIDDHSRFCVAAGLVARATSKAACQVLAALLVRYGVPDEILTDGKCFTGRFGPQPTEVLFDRILRENEISHRHTGGAWDDRPHSRGPGMWSGAAGGEDTMTVLVAYASKHGSTQGIAEAIGGRLRERGVDAEVRPTGGVNLERFDTLVVGSASEPSLTSSSSFLLSRHRSARHIQHRGRPLRLFPATRSHRQLEHGVVAPA